MTPQEAILELIALRRFDIAAVMRDLVAQNERTGTFARTLTESLLDRNMIEIAADALRDAMQKCGSSTSRDRRVVEAFTEILSARTGRGKANETGREVAERRKT